MLYTSYDEGVYCIPVMMRGRIVQQLCERKERISSVFSSHCQCFLALLVYFLSEGLHTLSLLF